ncbi:MAG: DUF1801 domain-containing protein [Tannerella sp.]|nr:DUF1801 domain-containing protein [Tannerella sp.]
MENKKTPENSLACIEEYIAGYPLPVQAMMNEMVKIIKEVAPEATEGLSWSMPTFKIKKILVQFAGHKNHVGFYPYPETIEHFKKELGSYKTSKGGIQFPYDKSLPYDLIKQIVKYNAGKLRG